MEIVVKVIPGGFLRGHARGLGLQQQPYGLAGFPVIEGEGLLAGHVEQQVPLADAAPQHHLNGVHAAGIVLTDAHHLLVVGKADVQQLHGILRRPVANAQTAAAVAVKFHTFFPIGHIS